jgi:hypothetical protein
MADGRGAVGAVGAVGGAAGFGAAGTRICVLQRGQATTAPTFWSLACNTPLHDGQLNRIMGAVSALALVQAEESVFKR